MSNSSLCCSLPGALKHTMHVARTCKRQNSMSTGHRIVWYWAECCVWGQWKKLVVVNILREGLCLTTHYVFQRHDSLNLLRLSDLMSIAKGQYTMEEVSSIVKSLIVKSIKAEDIYLFIRLLSSFLSTFPHLNCSSSLSFNLQQRQYHRHNTCL